MNDPTRTDPPRLAPGGLAALGLAALLAGCGPAGAAATPAPSPSTAADCPVTRPNGNAPPEERQSANYYGNGKLWVLLPQDSTYLVTDPGWIRPDGRIGLKWQWWRSAASAGKLSITGRRLDAETPPLEAIVPEGYGTTGHQTSGIIFSTPGCWEVTGRSGGVELTFVVRIVIPEASPQGG